MPEPQGGVKARADSPTEFGKAKAMGVSRFLWRRSGFRGVFRELHALFGVADGQEDHPALVEPVYGPVVPVDDLPHSGLPEFRDNASAAGEHG